MTKKFFFLVVLCNGVFGGILAAHGIHLDMWGYWVLSALYLIPWLINEKVRL